MAELRNLLAFMDEEDRERVLRRYERMFDAAGEDGEEGLIRSLGSPVRQVLDVESEYRRVKAQGGTPFLDADAPAPRQEDLSSLVREAADALKDPESEASLFPAAESDAAPELFEQLPIEELIPPEDEPSLESVIPETDEPPATPAEPSGEEKTPEEPELPPPAAPEEIEPVDELPADVPEMPEMPEITDEPADPSAETLPETAVPLPPVFDETVKAPAESPARDVTVPEEKPEEEPEDEEQPDSPGAGRILAAIAVTLPFLIWWAVGFAVSLALGAAVLAVGFAVCVAGVYLGGYAIGNLMSFMPDRLLVGGVALGCFAAALLLIWTGLWIIVGGISLVIRTSGRVYRRILNRQEQEEEDEIDG